MNEHVNDYTLIRFEIRIVAADSIRDSIRTKISDSQVPNLGITSQLQIKKLQRKTDEHKKSATKSPRSMNTVQEIPVVYGWMDL